MERYIANIEHQIDAFSLRIKEVESYIRKETFLRDAKFATDKSAAKHNKNIKNAELEIDVWRSNIEKCKKLLKKYMEK